MNTEYKRRSDFSLIFEDYPNFKPNLTPEEILNAGAFGGTYFRPTYSSITYKNIKINIKNLKNMDCSKF